MIGRLLRGYRNRDQPTPKQEQPATVLSETGSPSFTIALREMKNRCTECGNCVRNCNFLSQYGTPKSISIELDFNTPLHREIAYECSLCGLCAAVCPEKLDPGLLFLAIRRRHVESGYFKKKPYRALIRYEACGTSPLFSWYGLPQGCDTVFFPGCALPGTRPAVTLQIYQHLREIIPSLGLVLDCCTKPSHDLGRTAFFHTVFGEMLAWLVRHGVRSVITACPNCTKIFRQYGQGLGVETIYEIFQAHGLGKTLAHTSGIEISVHDPCALRDDPAVQKSVRGLLSDLGYTPVEMKHHKRFTVCCGEGGAVGCVKPQFAQGWTAIRRREAGARNLVAYCAGCTEFLNRATPTVHLLDLLFRQDPALKKNRTIARPPFTYWNRLVLKQKMKGMIPATIQRTRSGRK